LQKHRLFVGVEIDDNGRAALAKISERLRKRLPGLRFVAPENYHLTIAFLGNVADGAIAPVEAALARIASQHQRFSLILERIGAFPHERKPRIVYLGCRGASAEYRKLARDTNAGMNALGYGDEKDDVPHVTLARVVEGGRVALPMFDVPAVRETIDALTLFESIPHAGNTRYESRGRFPLGS
jgi:2'-5' RNA ligase